MVIFIYLYTHIHMFLCDDSNQQESGRWFEGVKEGLKRGKEDKKWCNTLSILEYFKAGNTHSYLYGTIREKLRSNLATLKVRELTNKWHNSVPAPRWIPATIWNSNSEGSNTFFCPLKALCAWQALSRQAEIKAKQPCL